MSEIVIIQDAPDFDRAIETVITQAENASPEGQRFSKAQHTDFSIDEDENGERQYCYTFDITHVAV